MQALYRARFCQLLMLLMLVVLTLPVSAEIIKSPLDSRNYRQLQLDNGLNVILVSDPETDKAAVSMNVEVGSNANPADRPGLAHFLEHMLFLGTEKYPEAGSYQAYISSHGGSHNAFTAYENTNYFFSVEASALPGAMDRFAQFFIAPLFTPEYVDRERHAVDSEFQAKRRDDGRRSFEAGKQVLNPEHHYSRFAVGNLKSLSSNDDGEIRDALIQFYQRYYSANLMTLAVLGSEPLDQLEQQVRALFAAVPNRNAEPYRDSAALFAPGRLPAQLNIETLRDTRQLSLSFPLPPYREYWRQKPLYYISSLIGYEGKGSLLSHLKQEGLARGLSAYPSVDLPDSAMLQIRIDLTEQGWQEVDRITESVFSFIELLRTDGADPALYQEEQQLADIQFRFRDKHDPMHLVMQLSQAGSHYPAEYLLKGDYYLGEFDAELIQRYLDQLQPDNLLLTLEGKNLSTDQIEPLYNTPYGIYPIATERLERWRQPARLDALQIRSPNPFIPSDLSLIESAATAAPEAIETEPGVQLWYQADHEFQRPRADFYFTLLAPVANQGPKQALLASLYTRMVEDELNETLYDASLAGLSASLYPHQRGISLRLSGFNDKQPLLLEKIVQRLRHPGLEQSRFERIKHQLHEQLSNSLKEKPYNLAFDELYTQLMQNWSTEARLEQLESIRLSDLQAFYPLLLQPAELRLLAHGNLERQTAKAMAMTVRNTLQPDSRPWQATPAGVVQLPLNEFMTRNMATEHHDSTVLLYLQGPDDSLKTRAATALINEIIATPFYTSLRTEKQFGYIVASHFLPLRERSGIALVVQSPNTDPLHLHAEYRLFLQQMLEQMITMPAEELERYRESLLSRINRQDNDLRTRSDRLWREIDRDNTAFDTREQLSELTRSLTRADLLQVMEQLLQRQLLIRSFGSSLETEITEESMQDTSERLQILKQEQLGAALPLQPGSGS
jgi:secreted Zn-dependent insulinase-like peptidase